MSARPAPPDDGRDDERCASMTAVGLDAADATEAATMFKALSDPTRVRLLSMIASHPEGEVCVCDLTAPVGLSQPTVSHHMSVLTKAGLAVREQRGTWAYFSLAPGAHQLVAAAAQAVLGVREPAEIG